MIILSILKVMGWILLFLFGLLLGTLLLLLFVPFSYDVAGTIDYGKMNGFGRVVWLFHLLGIYFSKTEEHTTVYVRVLFFRKKLNEAAEKEAEISPEPRPVLQMMELEKEDADAFEAEMKSDTNIETEKPKEAPKKEASPKKEVSLKKEVSPKKKTGAAQKKKTRLKKTGQKKTALIHKVKAFWEEESTRRALLLLKNELFRLFRRILPRRIRLNLEFSMGEPDLTGLVLGLLALFPLDYRKRIRIAPDFESDMPYAVGDGMIRGRIFVFQILAVVLRILLDKNCRKLYNNFKK